MYHRLLLVLGRRICKSAMMREKVKERNQRKETKREKQIRTQGINN
jgi:hypothetical protein